MISKEHKKHSFITKPPYGHFCRNEWAIVGTKCGTVQLLADDILKAFSGRYKCGYADATHVAGNNETAVQNHSAIGLVAEYNQHPQFHQFNFRNDFNPFHYRKMFNEVDLMIVNGNHHQAKSQVVVIDEDKKASLKKRVSELSNVELILLAGNETDVFDFIKEALPSWNKLPLIKLSDTEKIIDFFEQKMQQATPVLNGLVLAGGYSVRMGYDKGKIAWHGKEQQYYIADLLKNLCGEVYISCRSDQQKEIDANYKTIPDTFTGLGPYGAILSAFRENPGAAWLVVACDLPLLDNETLQYLKEHRNVSSTATTFESPYNGLPEPLITIWEPKSYPILLSFLSQGYSCPGKALQNSDTSVLKPCDPIALTNVNTPEDLEKIQHSLLKTPQ